MIAKAKQLPQTWGEDANIRWKTEIAGESWASPVVWGKKVFVATVVPVKVAPAPERQPRPPRRPGAATGNTSGERQQPPPRPPADLEEEKQYLQDIYRWEVSCTDLETGEELWKKVAYEGNPRIKKHRATNYASETPVTDGKRLYVYFGMTGLFCYDMEGELLWQKDLDAFETLNGWGTGSSPVLYRDKLFIQSDNEEQSFLVALDATTGEKVWRVERQEKTNYSTPIIWKNIVRTELVVGGKTARAYDPETGQVYWELAMGGYYNIPSPVANKEVLYMGNTERRSTPGTLYCIRAGAEGDITPDSTEQISKDIVWSNTNCQTGNPSPLLYENLLYLVSSRGGEIHCFDATTGEKIYTEKLDKVAACWSSPWAHEGRIYFTDEKGVTRVFKSGKEFELLQENVLEDRFWSSVAVTKDAYLLHGVEYLYCIATD